MSPEAQRIAIAEACGYRAEQWSSTRSWFLKAPDGHLAHHPLDSCGTREAIFAQESPDYLSDLNAMHEAEKMLPSAEADTFCGILFDLKADSGRASYNWPWCVVHTTAAQRAEAFLKTLGKWEESA